LLQEKRRIIVVIASRRQSASAARVTTRQANGAATRNEQPFLVPFARKKNFLSCDCDAA
jgi:hypothetical protein